MSNIGNGPMDELKDADSKSSCQDYELELRKVNASLENVKDEEVKAMLLDLKKSLTEVLELEKSLVNKYKEKDEENVEDYLEAEERRFKEELALLDKEQNMPQTHENLTALAGELCQAPHRHSWGSLAYHNALIASIDEAENDDGLIEKYVRVFFTNPTHREMLPCDYYLEGNCRFDADNCYFSHGEVVSASELRKYKAPDFERLAIKCMVLAKLDDKLWHRGRVTNIDMEQKTAAVILDADKSLRSFPFENLLPIVNEDESVESASSSDSEEAEDGEVECQPLAEIIMPNENIMCIRPKQALGEWEKHTRGIGSKLMEKMGYIHGNGLGTNGDGIIVPITAQVLPQGRSLDACMELREKANGDKNLFNVERKIKRDQRKQEQINVRAYERECKLTDVFSFLNDSVLSQQQQSCQLNLEPSTSRKDKRQSLQQASNKSLNVANMQICDDIRRKTREISKVEEALKRQTSGTESFKRLQSQLNAKKHELHVLKSEERNLCKEQASRKTSAKLSIF